MARLSLFSASGTRAARDPDAAGSGGLFGAANRLAFQEEGPTYRHWTHGPGRREPSFDEEWAAILANEDGINEDGTFRISRRGAVGPAQLMPDTGPEAAELAGLPWDERRFRTDRAYNEALGRAYYANLRRRFDAATAAAAYNGGPYRLDRIVGEAARAGRPDDWEQHLPAQTREYVRNFRRRLQLPDEDRPAPARR